MEDFTIGQRIAAKRKELGLSQVALGEQMGVSRQSISKWEADAAIPEIDKLIALSKLFGVSVGWLLGVEEDPAAEQENTAEFTDREWEIIDQLTQSQAKTPKWLVPLTAGAAAVSLCAAVLAGAALYTARSHREDLVTVSQAVANLTTAAGELVLEDTRVLKNYQFLAEPSGDMQSCTFAFYGYPPLHEEGSEAELLVILDGQEVCREVCEWTGTCYTTDFTLPAYSGYNAYFSITNKDGVVRTTMLFEPLLTHLLGNMEFGTVSVGIGSRDYDGSSLTLRDLRFNIDAPDVFRDSVDLWKKCDLVVLADGQELGRADILNRSKYSKQANFSKGDVNFYSQTQVIEIGDLSGFTRVELILDCGFNTGLEMQKSVHVWTVSDGKI